MVNIGAWLLLTIEAASLIAAIHSGIPVLAVIHGTIAVAISWLIASDWVTPA